MATSHGSCSQDTARRNGEKAEGTGRPGRTGSPVSVGTGDIASQTSGAHGLFRGAKPLWRRDRKEAEHRGRGDHGRRGSRGQSGQWGTLGAWGAGRPGHFTELPVICSLWSGDDDRHTGHRPHTHPRTPTHTHSHPHAHPHTHTPTHTRAHTHPPPHTHAPTRTHTQIWAHDNDSISWLI